MSVFNAKTHILMVRRQKHYMENEVLPLFVLPMVLFPGEIQELRVFEPRYRQMLDTCILDERPFGLVMNDPFEPSNGWDGPRRHGCEAIIVNHETRGSNHFITVMGGRRFFVERVIEPALPPFHDPEIAQHFPLEGVLPDIQQLLDHIPDDHPHQRLYISAEVKYLDLGESLTQKQQDTLRSVLAEVIYQAAENMAMDTSMVEDWVHALCSDRINEHPHSLYSVAAICLEELEQRQQLLACESRDEAMAELLQHLRPSANDA